MAENQPKPQEPTIWYEGKLIRDPKPDAKPDSWLLEAMPVTGNSTRKTTIRATGKEHSSNIQNSNAGKGTRLMVKGVPGDDPAGVDIIAAVLAFEPSHNDQETAATSEGGEQ